MEVNALEFLVNNSFLFARLIAVDPDVFHVKYHPKVQVQLIIEPVNLDVNTLNWHLKLDLLREVKDSTGRDHVYEFKCIRLQFKAES